MKTPFLGGKDVRTPADPADKQTTDAKTALPPVEFRVVRGTQANEITIQDRQGPQDRQPTVSYRIYFLPAGFAPKPLGTTTTVSGPVVMQTPVRASGRAVATLVATVAAPSLGTVLNYSDLANYGREGYYYCVGVNRLGVEAPAEHFVGVA